MTFEQWLEETGALLSPGSLAMARRTWEAATMVAVLAERERCAVLCESISAEDGIGSYKHEDDYAVGAVNALTRAAIEIREGVKS